MAMLKQHIFCGALAALASACASGGMTPIEDDLAPSGPRSSSMVTSADFDHSPGQSIENVIQSHIPGVTVGRTANGGVSLQIRGISTFMSGTEPLYIIDGTPVIGGLSGLSPYDIASIEVLKDPVSTSFYGVRGSNGVIVVKTKHAH
jgi:TonB-dependent starch-binding outer membrane protein SusC